MKKAILYLSLCIICFLFSCSSTIKVTYNFNNESNDVEEVVVSEGLIEKREDPVRDGYNFIGWKTEDGVLFDFSKEISEDINLYASWKETIKVSSPNVEYPRDKKTTYKDITYKIVGDEELKIDLYMPKVEINEKSPVVFFYFGGGWIMGDKKDLNYGIDYVNETVDKGIAVIAVNYRLCKKGISYPSPVEDCLDAIRYVVKWQDKLGIDINNMGSIGYSAGGHLATMTAFAQNYFKSDVDLKKYDFKLKFVVDMFGPAHYDSSLAENISTTGHYMLSAYLGFMGSYGFKDCSKAFPSYYLNDNSPNVLIIHGEEDSLVPINQSQILYEMMVEKNIPCYFIKVKGAEHILNPANGFNNVEPSLEEIERLIVDYIIDQTGK